MEWCTPPKPKEGQHRERLKFAWLPMKCEDGVTRWLCKVRLLEVFVTGYDMLNSYSLWKIVKVYRAEVETQRSKRSRTANA